MMISTRGRYALRVIIDLAEHNSGAYIPLKEIAKRQDISQKYMETIMAELSKNGLVDGLHGKGGGYRLKKEPDNIRVGDVLRLTEGELAPVACLAKDADVCERVHECRTLDMWQRFYKLTNDFFDGITVADLMRRDSESEYVI